MIKIKGFTLPEVVITIAIVGILSLAAVPIYRGYVRKAMSTEGKALLAEIDAAQKIYHARNGSFYEPSGSDKKETHSAKLGVDARTNKYFTIYKITTGDDDTFTATIGESDDKALILRGSLTAEPQIIDKYSLED